MKCFLYRISTTSFLLMWISFNLAADHCYGQSTVILVPQTQVFQSVYRGSNPLPMSHHGSHAAIERWERILDGRHPEIIEQEIEIRNLVSALRKLGLPVILTHSAQDDDAGEMETVTLPFVDLPLRTRLLAGLKNRNAGIAMVDGVIKIISLDDVFNEDFMMTRTYNVSQLSVDFDELFEHIMLTISPDDWYENGGLGTFSLLNVGGKKLLTVSQSYRLHRQVHSLLTTTSQLAGAGASIPTTASLVSIKPSIRKRTFNQNKNSGGIFSIPAGRK